MPKRLKRLYLPGRTGLILLLLWLLAIILVAGYTVKVLWDSDQLNARLREQNQRWTLTLLTERTEQELKAALLQPIGSLKNLSPAELDTAKFNTLKANFPYLHLILLLNSEFRIAHAVPKVDMQELESLLVTRIKMERLTVSMNGFGMRTFVEPLGRGPMLLALTPLSDANATDGWLVLGFDLNTLIYYKVKPALDNFVQKQAGTIEIVGPDAQWHNQIIYNPINKLLPGYFLAFQAAPPKPDAQMQRQLLPLSLSIMVLLALGIASWSAFREVYRSHAVADLRHRFVTSISHELKTPLALIRMYAETLHLGRIKDPERIATYYQVILRESERLSIMIQNVLDFASMEHRDGTGAMRDADLVETVTSVLADLQPTLSQRQQVVDYQPEANIPPIAHEYTGIMRILANLLDNAHKYASNSPVQIKLYNHEKWVRLEVIDSGPGIPVAERQRLLRPFERGHTNNTNVHSSGLGLALVTQVAEMHAAVFSLETATTGGLCARISFPMATDVTNKLSAGRS
ncbi:hypothetical protein TI04_01870 [Achromatium sp. WMS2]|nr:hypothetical protein TI04_01870 [Achromatium sp. WMS2]